jgi:hypothetical protein
MREKEREREDLRLLSRKPINEPQATQSHNSLSPLRGRGNGLLFTHTDDDRQKERETKEVLWTRGGGTAERKKKRRKPNLSTLTAPSTHRTSSRSSAPVLASHRVQHRPAPVRRASHPGRCRRRWGGRIRRLIRPLRGFRRWTRPMKGRSVSTRNGEEVNGRRGKGARRGDMNEQLREEGLCRCQGEDGMC